MDGRREWETMTVEPDVRRMTPARGTTYDRTALITCHLISFPISSPAERLEVDAKERPAERVIGKEWQWWWRMKLENESYARCWPVESMSSPAARSYRWRKPSVHIFLSLTVNITRNPCSPVTYSRLILRSTGETGPKAYGTGRGGYEERVKTRKGRKVIAVRSWL